MEILQLTSSHVLSITFISRDFVVRLTRKIYGVCRTRHAAASPVILSLADLESDFLPGEATRGNDRKRDRKRSTSTGSPGASEWRAKYELTILSRSRFRGRLAKRGERELVTRRPVCFRRNTIFDTSVSPSRGIEGILDYGKPERRTRLGEGKPWQNRDTPYYVRSVWK